MNRTCSISLLGVPYKSVFVFYRCLQMLLEQGATVDTMTQSGDTPLHLAVDGGHLACCQLLLHHGAEVSLPGAVSHLQFEAGGGGEQQL